MKKQFDPTNWDWYAYLAATREEQKKYHASATELASSWVTCACGQLCKDLPRDGADGPKDNDLAVLGLDFMSFIRYENISAAKETLDKIEKRTIKLLKQQK